MNVRVTPDGLRYMTTRARPAPFHARWLLPVLLRDNRAAWAWTSRASVVALVPLAWWYTGSPWMGCAAVLPGVSFNWRNPVLVDAPGMAVAVLAACLWPHQPAAAIALCVVGAAIRETVPVWVAIYTWSLWPLVAVCAVLAAWGLPRGPDPAGHDALLAHPIGTARAEHRHHWTDPAVMIYPWAGMVAALAALSPQLAVALGVGYGQMLTATDSVRLYQWAWPVVAAAVVAAVPPVWLPFVALTVLFNPKKGSGL